MNRKHRIPWIGLALAMCAALLVTALPALAEGGQKVLVCGKEEHTHTEACYTKTLTCGQEAVEAHHHTEACYTKTLICNQEAVEAHHHTDACREKVLSCGKTESPGHQHTEACYSRQLTCNKNEGDGGHVHTDACYTLTDNYICGQAESDEHHHTDACREKVLSCGKAEGEGGHVHTDACYGDVLSCGMAEGEGGHTHTDACYTLTDNIVCGKEETEGHAHTDACYEDVLSCGKAETEGHTHTDACYAVELTCTKEEHTHTEACYKTLYTITFDTDGGSAVAAISAEAGAAVTAPANPTKANCAFKGWSPELPKTMPAGDLTVKAQWVNLYTITWKNEDGTVIDTTAVEQGATPVHDAPVKEATPDMEYAFAGWTPAIVPATANAEYTAVFTGTVRQYTSGDYTYTLNAAGEATIIAWKGSDAELIVPQLLDNHAVVGIGPGAFANKGKLTRLDLPAGLRTIADNAFSGCPALETLLVPDSVEAIGLDTLKDDAGLKNFVLKAGLDRSLVAADSVQRLVAIDGVTTPVSVRFPMPFTDIEVNALNLAFTVDCDFTVAAEHHLTVAQGSTLNVAGQRTLVNLGAITNSGALNVAGTLINCAGTYGGNAPQGNYVTEHSFQDGVCTVCGFEDGDYVIELGVEYTGGTRSKVYDKTRNVKSPTDGSWLLDKPIRIKDFNLIGVKAGDSVEIGKLNISNFEKMNVGNYNLKVSFTLKGDDAKHYKAKDLTLSARITPKPLIITPTVGQKKTYGSADPAYITGKVRGLLSGDKMTGRLSRETGENAGQYRILAGTISAGDNYEIEVLKESFTIERKSINSTDVGLVTIGNQRYTGQEVTPDVTLRFGSNTLVENTDYKVAFENNIQPGTATVKLTGIGNYTGSRESAFRILNISSGVNFNSDSESANYGYYGFEDGEYEEMEDFDGEGDDEDDEEPGETGMLFLEGNDYGLVLFNTLGEPWNFSQFEEEVADGSKVLTIIADPLLDDETGEALFLDDGEREQYDELHLRLTLPTIRGLTELGYTEIIYELESADLRIPLQNLRSEIPLDADLGGAGTSLDVEQDDTELEGDDEELEMDIAPEAVQVAAYDFCVEQSEVLRLTDRELGALESIEPLTSAFRLRVRPMTQQDLAREDALRQSAADSGMALPIDNVEFDPMPENCYPEGLALYLMPLDDWDEPPEDAGMLYISTIDDAADRDEVVVLPAQFEDVDGMNYVRFDPTADGLYCAGWTGLDGGEEEEAEDE